MIRSRYFWTAFSIVLLLGVVAGTSYFIRLRMAALYDHGVSAQAKVTDLEILRSGSQGSRSTSYRVWMKVDEGRFSKSLSSDTDQATWSTLTVGGSVQVIYLPNEENVSSIGDRETVQRVYIRAGWFMNGSLALLFGIIGVYAVFSACLLLREGPPVGSSFGQLNPKIR